MRFPILVRKRVRKDRARRYVDPPADIAERSLAMAALWLEATTENKLSYFNIKIRARPFRDSTLTVTSEP